MHARLAIVVFVAAAVAGGESACAMTEASRPAIQCTVGGTEKLVAAVGGREAVCAIVQQAMASTQVEAAVHVEIVSAHAAVAQATAGGRKFDELRIDISDRELNRQAIERLANAVASQLSSSAGGAD